MSKKVRLKIAANYATDKVPGKVLSVEKFISVDNILPNKEGVKQAQFAPSGSLIKFCAGDILIGNIRPYLKKIWYAKFNGGCSPDVLSLRTNENWDSKYVYYSLFNDDFFEHMMKGAKGTKMPRGDKKQVLEFLISEYDLKSQQQIASVLSVLDAKIELSKKINAELEAMAKTLYDYWFVQFGFPDKKGKPYKSSGGKMVYNNELKREIPEGWEVKKLGKVTATYLGGTPSTKNDGFWSGDIPWLNSGEVANFPIISTDKKISNEAVKKSATKLLPKGTVLLSITRHLRASILGIEACINQSVVGITEIGELKSSFLYLYMLNEIPRLMTLRTGAQQPHINKEIVDESHIIIPALETLSSFSSITEPIFNKIISLSKQSQEITQLRDWLLPMLMNGQVKVADRRVEKKGLGTVAVATMGNINQTSLAIPANKKGFAKQVLAGKIVSLFKNDPNFTEIKFQKIQFLAEHIAAADLNLNYYYQAAGPYDNKFMHTIHDGFKKSKWFDWKNKQYIPLEKQDKIDDYFQGYFQPVQGLLETLFELLSNATEAESEIIATIYAVWNNRIIDGKSVKDDDLIQDFYNWSERKQQYSEKQIMKGLEWLRINQMEPKGFGKVIKKAKRKS